MRMCMFFTTMATLLSLSVSTSLAQRDVRYEDAVSRASGMMLGEAIGNLDANYVPHREPCRSIRDVGGTLWVVEYKDGFRVGNVFRACRGSAEVIEYFTGQSGHRDCDSYSYDSRGQERRLCFPDAAWPLVRAHGPIRVIWPYQRVGG